MGGNKERRFWYGLLGQGLVTTALAVAVRMPLERYAISLVLSLIFGVLLGMWREHEERKQQKGSE